ncbi:nuclear transport factor 2 family protein [Pseudarthrobacter enclensis]|uniref:Ketosteroid isomerase-like protein n=1 Tax=Pseudarthrobacter enclensis TaxID=993070 RepID=A0ABT9RV48_9MICC|nr:nuclear transport factor 2 family protein [Pseudarthrobacter enclensis]MDP9889098.1 ketosteroid isomerase-like protein [Pseudarthrobacter enclensis]
MKAGNSSSEAEIRDLEDQRYKAILTGDLAAFSALCHPDLIYTHSNGDRDSLESYVKKCEAGFYRYHQIEHPIERIVATDVVAVVAGGMRASLTAGGKELELDNSCLAVWVKENSRWKFLAYQPTVLPIDSSVSAT